MGIDGIFLYELKNELTGRLCSMRVEKVHQPSKEELVVLFRSKGRAERLIISIRPQSARLHLTGSSLENPEQPPMFCMLMRKYLSGAFFIGFEDNGTERVAVMLFDALNEMGDEVRYRLIAELIGKQTNLLLVDGEGRIVDSLRRSDIEAGGRLIQPGAVYTPPERSEKLNIFENSAELLAERTVQSGGELQKAVMSTVDGVSPLIAREICVLAGLNTDLRCEEIGEKELCKLKEAYISLKAKLNAVKPTVLIDSSAVPFEFSYTDISQYGSFCEKRYFDTLSELLDFVYSERDKAENIKRLGAGLVKAVQNLTARTSKKIAVRQKELDGCRGCETLRIYGELLKANLYRVERGATYIDVENYYDEELKTVRIPLDCRLTPQKNADKFFKDYKKCCNAVSLLGDLINDSKQELSYLESVADELQRASSVADLREIKAELISGGYLRSTVAERKAKQAAFKPEETVSPDGFRVLIGRNNRQNDELTLRIADKNDIWFHTKNVPGSHVIVKSEGKELPGSTVMFAAALAAKHSKAAASSSVPVDYTPVKFIKKPQGAKPGMVIYKTNSTVYVTPEREVR